MSLPKFKDPKVYLILKSIDVFKESILSFTVVNEISDLEEC